MHSPLAPRPPSYWMPKTTPNAAVFAVTQCTQPIFTHASMPRRASHAGEDRWRQPARLPPMRQLRRNPPRQLSLLSKTCRSASGTALLHKQTGSRLSFQLSYAAQPVNTQGGPFPRPWILSPPGNTPLQPIARRTLTAYPPDFSP